jgi:hypothetical protein
VSNGDPELNVDNELLRDSKVDNAALGPDDLTPQAVAAADQESLVDTIGSGSWGRRGLLQRLTRRSRSRAS